MDSFHPTIVKVIERSKGIKEILVTERKVAALGYSGTEVACSVVTSDPWGREQTGRFWNACEYNRPHATNLTVPQVRGEPQGTVAGNQAGGPLRAAK